MADAPARIGVQLYTVLQPAIADLSGTLARIAEMGYLGVETYGLWDDYTAQQVRSALDAAGLELASAHAPFPAGPDATRILDENAELGAKTLVWSLEREEFDSPEAITAGVVRVNEGAENAAKYGMRIAYHNHFAEFTNEFDGRQAYDLLLEQLDPRVVVELDVYWAQLGKADPAEVIARLGDRIKFMHVKDGPARILNYDSDQPSDILVPVGQGALDMPAALTAARHIEWHLVELERLDIDAFDALTQSYDFMVERGLSTGRTEART
jgi:sugar phosphate isomerase/epimerase